MLFGFCLQKNRYNNYEISKREVIFLFNNGFYVTRGVSDKIPLPLQIIMWELIEDLPVDKDGLQVFSLSEKNGKQRIIHTQEEPEYEKEYVLKLTPITTGKVFVIDDKTHSTMLMNYEY